MLRLSTPLFCFSIFCQIEPVADIYVNTKHTKGTEDGHHDGHHDGNAKRRYIADAGIGGLLILGIAAQDSLGRIDDAETIGVLRRCYIQYHALLTQELELVGIARIMAVPSAPRFMTQGRSIGICQILPEISSWCSAILVDGIAARLADVQRGCGGVGGIVECRHYVLALRRVAECGSEGITVGRASVVGALVPLRPKAGHVESTPPERHDVEFTPIVAAR